jgi:hypothetical protein
MATGSATRECANVRARARGANSGLVWWAGGAVADGGLMFDLSLMRVCGCDRRRAGSQGRASPKSPRCTAGANLGHTRHPQQQPVDDMPNGNRCETTRRAEDSNLYGVAPSGFQVVARVLGPTPSCSVLLRAHGPLFGKASARCALLTRFVPQMCPTCPSHGSRGSSSAAPIPWQARDFVRGQLR